MNFKKSVSIAVLCLTSIIGLKSSGVFLKDYVQPTYSGNRIYFGIGEKAEIIGENNDGFIVKKGKAKVTIPKEVLKINGNSNIQNIKFNTNEKKENVEQKTYKVIKIAPLKNDKKIIRNLVMNEKVVLISNNGNLAKIKTSDKLIGTINKANLKLLESSKPEVKTNETKVVNKSKADNIINKALTKLGSRYSYGSTGENGGYDCSGLIYSVYKNSFGINLPRTSIEQSKFGTQINKDNLAKGDLVFFNTIGNGVSHVGIYMGNAKFIHASSMKSQVTISSLDDAYFNSRYVNAVRVI